MSNCIHNEEIHFFSVLKINFTYTHHFLLEFYLFHFQSVYTKLVHYVKSHNFLHLTHSCKQHVRTHWIKVDQFILKCTIQCKYHCVTRSNCHECADCMNESNFHLHAIRFLKWFICLFFF
jgi:hypothetical protein